MGKKSVVIAVANNKGGVGKTNSTCNLAYGLSRKLIDTDGNQTGAVLIVDLDPQGNAADFFGVRPLVRHERTNPDGPCLGQLLLGRMGLKSSIIHLHRPGDGLDRRNLYLLPASHELERITMQLVGMDTLAKSFKDTGGIPLDHALEHYLEPAKSVFDFILLDCPPKLDALKRAVYHFADRVIVPTQLDNLSVTGAVQHTNDMAELREKEGVKAQIAYVLPTRVPHRQRMAEQMYKQLVRFYGRNVVAFPIPESVKVKESPGAGGQSLFEYAPDSAPAIAYQKLVDKVYHG